MQNYLKSPRLWPVVLAGVLTARLVSAQVAWTGADLSNNNLNWSDANNWSGGTPSGNTVVFPDGAYPVTTNAPGAVNNIVDTSVTITGLTYSNVTQLTTGSPVHDITTLIAASQTLTVNGNVTVGGHTNSLVTIAGTNCAFIVSSSGGTFGIGASGTEGTTNTWDDGTNIISVGTFSLGVSGSSNGKTSVLNLGNGTNAIYANTINLGTGKAAGIIQFAGDSGSLAIANAAGTGRATILMGNGTSGSGAANGQLLLTNHLANVLAGTVTIGAGAADTGNQQGTVLFDNGTFDATSILMGAPSSGTTVGSSTGTLTVGGSANNTATLIVNSPSGPGGGTLILGGSTAAGHYGVGTLNINTNGVAQIYSSITKTNTADNTNCTINVTGGSLMVTNGTIGTAAIPIDNFNITNATLSLSIPLNGADATVSTLNLGGTTNKLSISAVNPVILGYPVAFQVIKYATGNGTDVFNIGKGTLPPGGYTGFISNDVANSAVDVVITGGPAPARQIVWSGTNANNGNGLTSAWDINTTKDWVSNSTAVTYNDNGGLGGDVVTFNDKGGTNVVTLQDNVTPSGFTVSNNILNYTINDNNSGYAIGGSASLNKQGTGGLVLDNSGGLTLAGGINISAGTLQVGNQDANGSLGAPSAAIVNNGALVFSRNDSALIVTNPISGTGSVSDVGGGQVALTGGNTFSGGVWITNGSTLQAGNNSALGSTNGQTVIASGSALDVNGHNFGQEQVTVSGPGANPAYGAIYNSGTNILASIARMTMAGNTTIGGPVNSLNFGRWDLRSANTGDANGASLTVSPPGSAYQLTKVGANFIALTGVSVDPALGDIDIQGGALSIESATTGLGDPAHSLTVENGATLSIFSATNQFNKQIVLDGNGINNSLGTIDNSSGNNTVVGPMTLNGNVEITFRSSVGVAVGGSLTLSNNITGNGSLSKEDTNTLTLAGVDNHTGGTVVNDGTFVLNAINSNTANTLTVNQHTLTPNAIVGGNGTNSGAVMIGDTIWPGAGGTPSTFGTKNLSFNGAQAARFSLGSVTTTGSGVNDLLNVAVFDPEGSEVVINPVGVLSTSGTYTLVNYTSSSGSTFGSVGTLAASRYSFVLHQPGGNGAGKVTLTVSGTPAILEWNNAQNNGVWDTQGSQNWSNLVSDASADYYYDQDAVLLDDNITNSPTPTNVITIATNLAVMPMMITNNSSTNFVIVGPGKISGATGLVKLGSSKLTLASPNNFTGDVTIQGGSVAVTNSLSLGATNGTVYIANGATLDLSVATTNNGLNFGAKPFIVSGGGVGGLGAIINNGTNQQNVFQNVTMSGDTTFGGSARWDIRSTGNTNVAGAGLYTGSQPYNLTKVGSNYVALVAITVDPALADITVQDGILSFQFASAAGNPNKTISILAGARLLLYDLETPFNKNVLLTNGAVETDAGAGFGTNIVVSLVTLDGNNFVTNASGTSVTFSNVISGTGGLSVTNNSSGITYLAGTNTYTGNTTVSSGTLALIGTGSIATSPNLILKPGARLDVSGRVDGLLTLNSQTLSGPGTIAGSLSNAVGSTVMILNTNVSGIGTLTVTNSAWLAGTTTLKLDGNQTNDVLAVSNNITYGGTLTLNNISGSLLAVGNTWKLFNANTINGASSFSSIVPANPNNDPTLAWDTSQLITSGTIGIKSNGPGTFTNPTGITSFVLSGPPFSGPTNIVITGTNGQAGDAYYLLMSTNVALPKSQWQTVATNVLSASGNYTFIGTNVVSAGEQQQFFLLGNTNTAH